MTANYEPAADVARRLRRDTLRNRHSTRYWGGWRIEVTHGPYELAFDPAFAAEIRATCEQVWRKLHGEPPLVGPESDAANFASQRDLWHVSASWRGGEPVEVGKRLIAELVAALGVPEELREGAQVAQVRGPAGPSPQVTHWVWRGE